MRGIKEHPFTGCMHPTNHGCWLCLRSDVNGAGATAAHHWSYSLRGKTVCFCLDYRKLNKVTKRKFIRCHALVGWAMLGFFFCPLICAVVTGSSCEFCSAPATFQQIMDAILSRLKWQKCLVYLNGVVMFWKTFNEHLMRLRAVFGSHPLHPTVT